MSGPRIDAEASGPADAGTWEAPHGGGAWPQSASFLLAALYLALFVIRPWEVVFPWMQVIPVERTTGVTTIAVIVLGGRLRLPMTAQTVAVLAFLACVALSAMLGYDPDASQQPLYVLLTVVVLYFVFVSVIRTPRDLLAMVLWWVVVMALYMAKSLWEFRVSGRHEFSQGVSRLMGIETTFGHPNELAGGIAFSLPLLLFVCEARDEFGPVWRRRVIPCAVAYALLAATCVVLTNSRSGMLKVILFVVLVTLRGRGLARRLGYVAGGLAVLAVAWAAMPDGSKERFRTLWDEGAGPEVSHSSAQGRWDGLLLGLQIVRERPVSGVGIGNFRPYREANLDGKSLEAHNMYGQALGETGFLGTGAFMMMIGVTLANCRRIAVAAREHPDPALRVPGQFAVACRDVIVLLLFAGYAGHIMFLYHWIWMAAFSQAAKLHVDAARSDMLRVGLDEVGARPRPI